MERWIGTDPFAPGRQQPGVQVDTIAIRPATAADVPSIVALVNRLARRGQLLPRTTRSVYETLGDWLVAVGPEAGDEILGCVSLLRYTSGLVEVRSLAVQEAAQGRGIGSHLMQALIAEAKRRHISTLFALTRAVPFFRRFGFAVTERERFPEKVWHDCQQCPLLHNCDETAMILEIMPK